MYLTAHSEGAEPRYDNGRSSGDRRRMGAGELPVAVFGVRCHCARPLQTPSTRLRFSSRNRWEFPRVIETARQARRSIPIACRPEPCIGIGGSDADGDDGSVCRHRGQCRGRRAFRSAPSPRANSCVCTPATRASACARSGGASGHAPTPRRRCSAREPARRQGLTALSAAKREFAGAQRRLDIGFTRDIIVGVWVGNDDDGPGPGK